MTSPVDTSVKFFHSGLTGAPSGATIGGTIAVLDACLITGWNALAVSSITVAGGVATVLFGTTPAAEPGMVIQIAGATTKTGLNGEQRVTGKTSNTLTFATAEADGVASGSITYKIAPVGGWTKPFTSTNTAVFKQGPGSAGGLYLRVYESGTVNALLTGYESMSDADTGVAPFPTVSQIAGGGVLWLKGATWVFAGDEAGFHLHMSAGLRSAYYFGDVLPDKAGDGYACYLAGKGTDWSGVGDNPDSLEIQSAVPAHKGFWPRADTQIGGSQPAYAAAAPIFAGNAQTSGGAAVGPILYPNPADNSLRLSTFYLAGATTLRGVLPGMYFLPQPCHSVFAHLDTVAGTGALTGRNLRMCRVGSPSGGSNPGLLAIDASGPWR